jgi:nicotinamide-nucleotide amidase
VNAEIVAVGSEMLTPFRQDTNSLTITEQLNLLGVAVEFKTIVGDKHQHLVDVARIALRRADIIVFMGGLGPTEDDLTREAVAEALGITLKRDNDALAALYTRFAALRVSMTDNNKKQADLLDGAQFLENKNGSAPGQWLDTEYLGHRKIVLLLPGPPSELKPLFLDQCVPRLRALLPERHIATRVLKMTMIGESKVDSRVAPIYTTYPDVETTILSSQGEIQLHLVCAKPTKAEAQARVNELAGKIEDEMDDFIFSSHGESLEQIVLYYLDMRSETISVAESCTGGLVAERLTSISGSSRAFLGGAVVYSNALKIDFAGVPEELLEDYGAVSSHVAEALAEGIRRRTRSSIGLGITGIAGPGGGSEEKPVGLVYIAVADNKSTSVVERRFTGDRERIRWYASQQALDLVRRKLM